MCVVGSKFINGSWILFKNRDRNYKPEILIRKSFRKDVERLYVWDDVTKYSEGINEYGVAIVSASVMVKEDEAEGAVSVGDKKLDVGKTKRTFYSPDGLRIRTALFEKNAVDAARKLIELEIPGNTVVADVDRCFMLEGAFVKDDYVYKIKEIDKKTDGVLRTNHGIYLPFTGYNADIPEQKDSRVSSDSRYKIASELLKKAEDEDDIWSAISYKENNNPQLNPLRIDLANKAMRTTGQIMISTKEKVIHYRPIWCNTSFDLEKINRVDEKTYFEIVSTRKLLTFKEMD